MRLYERENQIMEAAPTPEAKRQLWEDRNYGTAQAFWSTAVYKYHLATAAEYENARRHYGDLWNYRGD